MKLINVNTWKRKQLFNHFKDFNDPYFAVTISFDVTEAYRFSKANNISFFGKYLHDCMKAINNVESLRYRIKDGNVIDYEIIHASATIMRTDKTYGFSMIKFDEDLNSFLHNFNLEKHRIINSTNLYPSDEERLDCIHCSAMPWVNFSGHKEPNSGKPDSVPKLAFSKVMSKNNKRMMNLAISVNHALVDGYDIGLFADEFQKYLND